MFSWRCLIFLQQQYRNSNVSGDGMTVLGTAVQSTADDLPSAGLALWHKKQLVSL